MDSYKVGRLTGMAIGWDDTKLKIIPIKSKNEFTIQGTFVEPIGKEIEELIKIIETPSIVDDLTRQLNKVSKQDLWNESYIRRLKITKYLYNYPIFTFLRIDTSYYCKYNHETNKWTFVGTGRH